MTQPSRWSGLRSRKGLAAVVAVLVAAAVVVVVVVLTTGSSGGGGTSSRNAASSSTSAAASSSAGGTAAAPSSTAAPSVSDQNAPPPTLAATPLSATASESNGVAATLPSITSVQAKGSGAGEISGPALRVTVRLKNGTGQPIDVSGVAVNMYYGSDRTPASPVNDPSTAPFHGTLAAGKTADGVYVFRVPEDQRQMVTVEVGYTAGAPLLVFSGPVK